MAPRRSSRRSTQLEQRQSDLARTRLPPVSSFDRHEEEVPFLQDDWWTLLDHSHSLDSIEPFLHFPDEIQNTLTDICSGPPAATATAAAAALPKPAPRRKENSSSALGVNANGKSISSRESHVMSERQRRKEMTHLFGTLAALLPENAPKGDKSTVVSQIILYIQSLQGELEELSKKRDLRPKLEETRTDSAPRSFRTTSTVNDGPVDSSLAPNVVFRVCGPDAFVTMSADSSRSLLVRALTTLQQHRLEVLDGHISSSGSMMFYYFHAKVLNGFQVPQDLVQTALQRLPPEAVTSSPSAET